MGDWDPYPWRNPARRLSAMLRSPPVMLPRVEEPRGDEVLRPHGVSPSGNPATPVQCNTFITYL
jgi:hypothetical protein